MRCLGVLTVALLILPAASLAAPPAADAFVRGKVDELADLLAGDKADRMDQVRDRVREVSDFTGFSERALGKTWGTLSKDERVQFQAALQGLLESHYMAHPGKVFDKKKLVVQSAKPDAEGAVVSAVVKQKDVDIGVIVKLRLVGDNWQVRDVVLDNLSLLEDYRAQFQSYLKKKTLAELITKLKSKAAANLAKKG